MRWIVREPADAFVCRPMATVAKRDLRAHTRFACHAPRVSHLRHIRGALSFAETLLIGRDTSVW